MDPFDGHQFGGNRLASAVKLVAVADILLAWDQRRLVAVWAMKRTTDVLIWLVQQAAARKAGWNVRECHKISITGHLQQRRIHV